jgi:hypothetical protein
MRTYAGTYGKDTIESNALSTNLLKYPEIASTLIRQFPQYSTAYFVDGFGRQAKEELIGDRQFKWFIQGRLSRPSTCTGTSTGTGVGNTQFSVEFEENYFNPYDVVRFASGVQAVILSEPTATAGGYTFQMKLQSGSATAAIVAADVVAGLTVGKVGTAFPEKSERGYENHVYPDQYTNWMTLSRKSSSISGDAATDVLWIEHNGQRLWFFKDEVEQRDQFMYENEIADWYGTSTMDANGNPMVFDNASGLPIYAGDGLLNQIDAANVDTYSGSLSEDRITEFLTQLRMNTGMATNQWLVYTGNAGKLAFHRAMKDLVMDNGNLLYDANVGRDQEIGVNFTSYSALGDKITLVHNPIFDDPNIHGNNIDAASGLPKESFRMVFLNFGMQNGVSNIERKVKGAGGISRSMVTKYIPGMINPFDQKSMMAANSRDSFSYEFLRESCLVVRNPLSCGQLKFA